MDCSQARIDSDHNLMSLSIQTHRMATSLAIAAVTAAITACGGGSADSTSDISATSSGSAAVVSEASSSAAGGTLTTTNTNVLPAASTATTTAPSSTPSATATNTSAIAPTTSTDVANDASADPAAGTSTVVASNNVSAPTTVQSRSSTTSRAGTPGVARPAGNTGTGFFVSGNKLYDKNGQEFRVRGVNRGHWDSPHSGTGIPASGANTERMVVDFTRPAASSFTEATEAMNSKIVPMPSNWGGTCKSDVASLSTIVDTWVAQAATWTKLNDTGLINIANEWGPPDSTFWRDQYITAITRMRAAGYTGTLVVDAGGCGQDTKDVINYGAAVLAADPQKNILFDVHVYGNFYFPATATWMQDYTKSLAALKATGLPVILGEFGPGKNIGPSPTLVTPQQVIATAEDAGWGWIAWAWDDNNLAGCQANDYWFSMTVNCGAYATDSDLTAFGKTVVPMLKQMAVTATIFN